MDDRFNTIAGWVLFAGVVGLGLSIVSSGYFHAGKPDDLDVYGHTIEVADAGGAEEEVVPLGNLLAAASAADGAGVFAKCQSCHSIEQGGANGIGPNLYGIMGKPKAAVAGFSYSSALQEKGGDWSWENMDAWLAAPKRYVPGTSMGFAGLSREEERADLLLYLAENGGAPAQPEPVIVEEPAADDAEMEQTAAE